MINAICILEIVKREYIKTEIYPSSVKLTKGRDPTLNLSEIHVTIYEYMNRFLQIICAKQRKIKHA